MARTKAELSVADKYYLDWVISENCKFNGTLMDVKLIAKNIGCSKKLVQEYLDNHPKIETEATLSQAKLSEPEVKQPSYVANLYGKHTVNGKGGVAICTEQSSEYSDV